mgnify:CR=1 FL=1
MNNEIIKANSRGRANHGWLQSFHTFSFASYYNPKMMGFGALRVLNDDTIAPSMGFSTHSHRDMEIISVPLKGSLKHKDSMGNEYVIGEDEIQVMSAGTGVSHSEFNNSSHEEAQFLQIWIMPKKLGVRPRYLQKSFKQEERLGQFQLIVSPDGRDHSLEINQDAFISMIKLESGQNCDYQKHAKENGVFFFNMSGKARVDGMDLDAQDSYASESKDQLLIEGREGAELLILEVPMLR